MSLLSFAKTIRRRRPRRRPFPGRRPGSAAVGRGDASARCAVPRSRIRPAPYPASHTPSATPAAPAARAAAATRGCTARPTSQSASNANVGWNRGWPSRSGRAMREVDLEPPPAIGRLAVELLVEPVAEASDGLAEREPRRREVEQPERGEAAQPRADRERETSAQRRTEDAESPAPDRERALALSARAAGHEVVEAGADQRTGKRGEADPPHVVGGLPAPPRDERGHDAEEDGAERDEQAVPVAAEGSEPQLRRPGARHVLPGLPRRSFGMVRNSHWGIV